MNTDYQNKKILGIEYPVIGLSPMDGVTDAAYRYIVKKYGNPDLIFTEFTNVTGMIMAPEHVLEKFDFNEIERPIIGQIYGNDPIYFYHAAKVIAALGFDAVDINMGCPSKNVSGSGSGAGLIRTPDLAKEIVLQVQKGVSDWVNDGKLTGFKPSNEKYVHELIKRNKDRITEEDKKRIREKGMELEWMGILNLADDKRHLIPVSIKTRIGFDTPITEQWISHLNTTNPEWITVHGRTLKQMYRGNADYNELKKAVTISKAPIIVNGDITSIQKAKEVIEFTGAIGALIGRGAWGNPGVFAENELKINNEKLEILLEHAELFDNLNNHQENLFVQMRKHFGWYIKGFDNAKELRIKLMTAKNLGAVKTFVSEFIQNQS